MGKTKLIKIDRKIISKVKKVISISWFNRKNSVNHPMLIIHFNNNNSNNNKKYKVRKEV